MDLVDYLGLERRRLRDCAAGLEAALGPQDGLGWNDCRQIDGRRFDRELAELGRLLKRLGQLESRFAWPLLRQWREPALAASELEQDEARLEGWIRLIRSVVAAGDCLHVHAVRGGLRSLVRELDAYLERAEEYCAGLRLGAAGDALEELGRRAARS